MHPEPRIWGLVAEFERPDDVLAAARTAHERGHRHIDAYSPFPIEGLAQALGFRYTRLPLLILAGGIIGCIIGFTLQYWVSCIEYPQIVGGKPDNSWPAFIPITFEVTVLCAAVTAVLGMLGLNRLPQPYHPLFNVKEFRLASHDRFFLSIAATDPMFDMPKTRAFLEGLRPLSVREVEP